MFHQFVTHLEYCIETFRERIKIGTRFTKTNSGNSTLSKLSSKNLSSQQSKDPKEKEKKDEERDNSFDGID